MASRRRRRKGIGKVLTTVERKVRRIEKRPGPKRVKSNSITTEKIVPRAIETKKIATDAVTPNEADFGVTFVTATEPTEYLKEGTTWVDPTDGATQVYSTDINDFVTVTDAAAQADAAAAVAAANYAVTTADGKNKIFFQGTTPTATATADQWIDTSNGNILKIWNGTSWVSAQDTAVAAASSAASAASAAATAASAAATAAQSTADGKNKVFRQTSAPTATATGDLWFDTDDDNRIYRWDGSAWVANNLGNAALGNLSADKLTSGSINASVIAVSNINAGNISTGTLSADRIASASITGAKIAANTITASNITAGTITATEIATGTITANRIATGTLTSTQIATGGLDAFTITGATIRTSANTARVEITSSGFFAYNTSGTQTVSITASSGAATFTGTINANAGYIGSATTGWSIGSSSITSNQGLNTYLGANGNAGFAGDLSVLGAITTTKAATISHSTGTTYISTLQVGATMSIVGGYGITSDWSPNTNATTTTGVDLGQATQRWRRVYAANTTISSSDARLKTSVVDAELGLNFIKSLRPVSYKFINGDFEQVLDEDGNPLFDGVDALGKPIPVTIGRAGVRRHWGFIAQEVKQAVDASGVEDFAGWVQDDLSDPSSNQSLSYEQFIAPLTKAVQELATKVEELESRI